MWARKEKKKIGAAGAISAVGRLRAPQASGCFGASLESVLRILVYTYAYTYTYVYR